MTYVNRGRSGIRAISAASECVQGNVQVVDLLDVCLRERAQKARLPVSVETAPRLMELEYEFGAKRLRGEPVNPVEIADAYLGVIEQYSAAARSRRAVSAVPIEEPDRGQRTGKRTGLSNAADAVELSDFVSREISQIFAYFQLT